MIGARKRVYIVEVDRERLREGCSDRCIRLFAVRANKLEPKEFSEEAGGAAIAAPRVS